MKALIYKGKEKVALEDIAKPKIEESGDAVLRITTAAICGSDLHTYKRDLPQTGLAMGHELMGIIEEAGDGVKNFKQGDRVVVPFSNGCGICWFCKNNWPTQCTDLKVFGKGDLSGGQAEFARIPRVDANAVLLPKEVPDEEAIFLADIFPTGFFAAENGSIRQGQSVAVLGCGPVGLCAQIAAQLFNPALVIALDSVPYRLEMAEKTGSKPVDISKQDWKEQVMQLTEGRGLDAVLEAVGGEGQALQSAFDLVRGGGTVSMVGVPTEDFYSLPIIRMFRKDITFKVGVCPARRYIEKLIPLILEKKVNLSQLVSHAVPLEKGPEAYQMFYRRDPGVMKILLKP